MPGDVGPGPDLARFDSRFVAKKFLRSRPISRFEICGKILAEMTPNLEILLTLSVSINIRTITHTHGTQHRANSVADVAADSPAFTVTDDASFTETHCDTELPADGRTEL